MAKGKLGSEMKRRMVQVISALLTNPHIPGFIKGGIYQGSMKMVCVPGMNCYSCPAATAACPIGAIQAVIGSRKFSFSFYVMGTICLLGVLLGRFICGWLCLFGLVQDLLYKIPVPKLTVPQKADKILRYAKYVFLVVFVLGLPAFLNNEFGISMPYFCKLVCPVGMLEGGIPLTILNESLRETIGFLFGWKFLILAVILVSSMVIYRPFCKYICPLGALYSLFNKVSFLKIHVDSENCTSCGLCRKACDMGVDVTKNPDSAECIRCGKCVSACPRNVLHMGMTIPKQKAPAKDAK